MKLIGLLGGMGWQSTIEYYRKLNELVHQQLDKYHSARIVLLSPDYEDIKQYTYEQTEERGEVLLNQLLELASCNPDCILICNNTLHKVFDEIKPHLYIETPVLHVVEVVGEQLAANHMSKVLLLGTQFTMEDGFFEAGLKKEGVSCTVPSDDERKRIQEIHDTLLQDEPNENMKQYFQELIGTYADNIDGVLLACTELPLVVSQEDCEIPIINTIDAHCQAAIDFAL